MRMRLYGILVPTSILLAMLAPQAARAVFLGVSDGRSVHADFFDPYYSDVRDDSPAVPFDAWVGNVFAGGAYWAMLDSEAVTATRMAASGQAHGFSEIGSASALFQITFDVDVPTAYALSGQLVEDPSSINDSSITLLQGSTTIFSADAGYGVLDFQDTGVLAPGRYQLLAEASWGDNFEGLTTPASFDFVFQVVPEPGASVLAGLAGALLLAARTRLTVG